jgi:hypothetical protein
VAVPNARSLSTDLPPQNLHKCRKIASFYFQTLCGILFGVELCALTGTALEIGQLHKLDYFVRFTLRIPAARIPSLPVSLPFVTIVFFTTPR